MKFDDIASKISEVTHSYYVQVKAVLTNSIQYILDSGLLGLLVDKIISDLYALYWLPLNTVHHIETVFSVNVQSESEPHEEDNSNSVITSEEINLTGSEDESDEDIDDEIDEELDEELTLEEIQAMEKAKAGEEEDGGYSELEYVQYGNTIFENSVPRDLGLSPFSGEVIKIYLPVIDIFETGPVIFPDIDIEEPPEEPPEYQRCELEPKDPPLKELGSPPEATVTITSFVDEVDSKNGITSLREAIVTANGTTADEVIYLTAGTYELGLTGKGKDTENFGDLDILDNLTIVGNGLGVTFIDANLIDRILEVSANVTLTLWNLTITGGLSVGDDGGGILNKGNLNLYNVSIVQNAVEQNGDGGGIASIGGGSVLIVNSIISENTSERAGGGIYYEGLSIKGKLIGDLDIENSIISDNLALRNGGGIYITDTPDAKILSTVIHENTTNSGNSALSGDSGGGIFTNNTTLLIDDSTIACNETFQGGGIASNKSEIVIVDSTIYDNFANGGKGFPGSGQGGGIFSTFSDYDIINSTISGNVASEGSAIDANNQSTFEIFNTTITNNVAESKGTTGAVESASGSAITLESTIIANNLQADNSLDQDIVGKTFTSNGFNLIGDISESDLVAQGSDIIGQDPLLGPLQDNGGLTYTHALLNSSPAIDSGSNPLSLSSDQREFPFVRESPSGEPDIGAYEKQGLLAPIFLDMDGDGVEIISILSTSLLFDANQDGVKDLIGGWVAADDAFLAFDYNGDRQITETAEIAFTVYNQNARTDLEALRLTFDQNQDNVFDSLDDAFSQFGIWQDKNQNAISEPGEFMLLQDAGITSLSVISSHIEEEVVGSVITYGHSYYTLANGDTHSLADVVIRFLETTVASAELPEGGSTPPPATTAEVIPPTQPEGNPT